MDVDEFVFNDLEENPMISSLRELAAECVEVLLDSFKSPAINALLGAVNRCFQQGVAILGQGDEAWWKWPEAGINALKWCAHDVAERLHKPKSKIDQALLQTLLARLPEYAGNPAFPFLMARSLSAVSMYSEVIAAATLSIC